MKQVTKFIQKSEVRAYYAKFAERWIEDPQQAVALTAEFMSDKELPVQVSKDCLEELVGLLEEEEIVPTRCDLCGRAAIRQTKAAARTLGHK